MTYQTSAKVGSVEPVETTPAMVFDEGALVADATAARDVLARLGVEVHNPRAVALLLEHGAAGFIPKSSGIETITQAIAAILMGEIWVPAQMGTGRSVQDASELELVERMSQLTPQQFKVLMMMSQGLLNKQIAYELKVSEATVKAHVTAIMHKLGVSNRTQAVLAANRLAVANPNSAL